MTNRIADLLDQAITGLHEALSDDAIAGLSEAEHAQILAKGGEALRLSEAVIVEAAASADSSLPRTFGCRSMNELLRRATRVDAGQAARFLAAVEATRRVVSVTSGERLDGQFPRLRDALLDGVIGVAGLLASTGPLRDAHHRIGTPERLLADADLAAYARGRRHLGDESGVADGVRDAAGSDDASPEPAANAEDLKQAAYEWAMALDPDGAEPSDRDAAGKRSFTIGALRGGYHRVGGNLLPEVAAQLQLIFDAYNNPKVGGAPIPSGVFFADAGGDDRAGAGAGAGGDVGVGGGVVGSAEDADPFNADPYTRIDDRTAPQKRHDALAAALGIASRHDEMPKLGGAAPTLVVHVDAADYASGAGWATLAGTLAPVPLNTAAHTACVGAVQRVLFDGGRIVGISVTDRVFTAHQRRAIILRDQECLIPGCHVPAMWCEIHHVKEHQDGGPTETDNGVPVCWWHHRNLGNGLWEIRMRDGVPQIRGPVWWDPEHRWRTPRLSAARARVARAGAARAGPGWARAG